MSKVKSIISKVVKGYFNLYSGMYDERYYKYQCRTH